MDPLDRLGAVAGPLLAGVDATLAGHGAAPAHPVWSAVRRVGLLPGAAVDAVAALRPAPAAEVRWLRVLADAYADAAAELACPPGWTGPAADAYAARAAGLEAEADAAADRAAATLRYAADLADWVRGTRDAVARALAEVLGAAQTVTLAAPAAGGGPGAAAARARAAADVGARVLSALADRYDAGERLLASWTPRLVELGAPAGPGRDPGAPTAVDRTVLRRDDR